MIPCNAIIDFCFAASCSYARFLLKFANKLRKQNLTLTDPKFTNKFAEGQEFWTKTCSCPSLQALSTRSAPNKMPIRPSKMHF